MAHTQGYYVPHGSNWPIVGAVGLFVMMLGIASAFNGAAAGSWLAWLGVIVLLVMIVGWFGTVINESESGAYNAQVDRSFRMGMTWFIISEVMFFAAFFGALFYARQFALPWLGGEGNNVFTNMLLWQGFETTWPTNGPGEIGGDFEAMPPLGLPALNTAILLSSGVTITIAHHALKDNKRGLLALGLFATWFLGFLFVGLESPHAGF